ncbi:TPA: universal stress protein UspE [Photobacterium damselae]|uniref:Universal stress protein E n=2 Tax=Photobacterium damselae TaxID=38293 RepID=A0A1Q9H5A9_PHODP|nr:universal stress protein UspE [Photobacterium damselae]ARR49265.1 universal stress protein UspE [Photobacterium damselae subsp. damselae]EJN6960909.1 universal stress protein UspE [Photobacterium damselae]KAB1508384.1 universal stress protein UspE [Photobacterium damselae subsp. damselae]MBE8129319.1 universal stress protein UspE [Photobacterium damselae subsp. piscicida]MCG3845757.1 universal stress protein UspE [Photobacterium damselae]
MKKYKNILVVADPNQDYQPALVRAAYLAKHSENAKITLFLAIYDFSYEMTSMLSADERIAMRRGVVMQREEWLKEIIEPYKSDSYEITISVVWHNRPYEAVIAEVFSQDIELLIKATHNHDTLGSVIFTPTDWHLLRKCPCPVLLVKDQEWQPNGKVLACVNLAADNETHEELNDNIIDEANRFAHVLEAEVNLVNAYPSTPVNITIELPEFDPASYTDAVRGHHLTSMKALRQKYGIDEAQTHVLEGLPEDIIPRVAEDLGVEMVVLGTTGRTGLSAVFIGNTAEHTIDRLNCDLLALKPTGYISPLAPNIE